MKRLTILMLAALLALSLAACKEKEPPAVEDKDYDSFRDKTAEMTVEDAETYLQENTDDTTPEYKEAVYTVNEEAVSTIIEEARQKETETLAIREALKGITFKFREGNDFSDPVIKQKLFMRGNWAPAEEGWYFYTFIDTTLANTAVTMDNDHALKEYTEVLELLLSDPNVIVKEL